MHCFLSWHLLHNLHADVERALIDFVILLALRSLGWPEVSISARSHERPHPDSHRHCMWKIASHTHARTCTGLVLLFCDSAAAQEVAWFSTPLWNTDGVNCRSLLSQGVSRPPSAVCCHGDEQWCGALNSQSPQQLRLQWEAVNRQRNVHTTITTLTSGLHNKPS